MLSDTRLFSSLAAVRLPGQPLHLAIGMFDGVHLGHQAVIESALHSARREGGLAGVLTFDPHPSRLFRPQQPVRMLMAPAAKNRFLLTELGVDFVVEEPFTREFASAYASEMDAGICLQAKVSKIVRDKIYVAVFATISRLCFGNLRTDDDFGAGGGTIVVMIEPCANLFKSKTP